MIYVHSKVMVVDDRHLIIGSANINDRSMLGSRDHEIAVVSRFTGTDARAGRMACQSYQVSRMVSDFRTELMMEHFGLERKELSDPLASKDLFQQVASNNSKIYFEIFQCEPDNKIRNFEGLA